MSRLPPKHASRAAAAVTAERRRRPRTAGWPPTLVEFILEWRAMHNYSELTRSRTAASTWATSSIWCEERGLSPPDEITRRILERYQQHVFHYRASTTAQPLTFQHASNAVDPGAGVLPVARAADTICSTTRPRSSSSRASRSACRSTC